MLTYELTTTLQANSENENFGQHIHVMNTVGTDESMYIIVSAPIFDNQRGKVMIYDSNNFNIKSELEGQNTYDNFGKSKAMWNGHLAIGSPYDDTCTAQSCDNLNSQTVGSVSIYKLGDNGSSLITTIHGDQNFGAFGSALMFARLPVEGINKDLLIIGEHWADGELSIDRRSGRVHIYDIQDVLSNGGSTKPLVRINGSGFGAAFGTAFTITSKGDLAISAPLFGDGSSAQGQVYILTNNLTKGDIVLNSGEIVELSLEQQNTQFGGSLAGIMNNQPHGLVIGAERSQINSNARMAGAIFFV